MKRVCFLVSLALIAVLVAVGCSSTGGAVKEEFVRTGDVSVVDGYKVTLLDEPYPIRDVNAHTEIYLDPLFNAAPDSEVYFFFIKTSEDIDGMGGCGVIGPDWSEAPTPGDIEVIVPEGTGTDRIFKMGPYTPAEVISWEAGWALDRVVLGSWANGVLGVDRAELWEPIEVAAEEVEE